MPYNDLDAVRKEIEEHPNRLAAIIVEPVAGNMGVVPPKPGFLQGLRELCSRDGAVLIFDEVITGFRVSLGGAQQLYGINPDITCLGKIMGGGLPVAAFGGPKRIMEYMAPSGGVYQAGTLSGNPLAVAAGLATLRILRQKNPYPELERKSAFIASGIKTIFENKGIEHTINRVGSMFSVFFHSGPVSSYEEALKSDREAFAKFFASMLEQGIYLAPSPFEAWFVSSRSHPTRKIERTLEAVKKSV